MEKTVRMGAHGFPLMQDIIPEGKSGEFVIEHFKIEEAAARFAVVHGMMNQDFLSRWIDTGDFVRLMHDQPYYYGAELHHHRSMITSDAGGERYSSYEICHEAHGSVLIAGLGIGMILTAIVPKPEVTNVTVVEISQDVINLVENPLREYLGEYSTKLEVVHEDIYKFIPQHKYNVIWFDIWGNYSGDTYEDTKKLHHRYLKWYDRSDHPYMNSWMRQHMKELHFRDKDWEMVRLYDNKRANS